MMIRYLHFVSKSLIKIYFHPGCFAPIDDEEYRDSSMTTFFILLLIRRYFVILEEAAWPTKNLDGWG
jgi:hypothetical protein